MGCFLPKIETKDNQTSLIPSSPCTINLEEIAAIFLLLFPIFATYFTIPMANAVSFTCVNLSRPPAKPLSLINPKAGNFLLQKPSDSQKPKSGFFSLKATSGNNQKGTKPNSIVCAECDGNGAKSCTQCKGTGVNSVDHFNGQFKAGGLCWLCRGKREILCGNCNGAGFIGGFMSSFDD